MWKKNAQVFLPLIFFTYLCNLTILTTVSR